MPLLKNKAYLYFFAGILILFLTVSVLFYRGINMDEIWVYQFARRILNQEVPYRDFFMIVTPLQAQIDALLLRCFSDQMFVLRLFALGIALLNGYLFYLISLKLSFTKTQGLILALVFCICFSLFPINNYNWLSVFWLSLILWLLLSNKNPRQAFLIGLFASMLLLTKQNIGIYLFFGLIFIFLKFRYRFVLFVLPGFLIGLLPEIFYFYAHRALGDFVSIFYGNMLSFYKEFSHSALIYIVFLCILGLIAYLYISKQEEKRITLLIVTLTALGFSFPILDWVHLLFSFLFLALLLLYCFSPKYKLILYCLIGMLYCLVVIFYHHGLTSGFLHQDSSLTDLPHFKNIPIETRTKRNMEIVVSYIKDRQNAGKNCYVIDFTNVLMDIALDRCGLKYDSMVKGNFGEQGDTEVINHIREDKNALVILYRDFINPKQQTRITEYVKMNLLQIPTFNENYLIFTQK